MSVMSSFSDLKHVAMEIRKKFLSMHFTAKAGHIGSGLSDIEMLTYLYWRFLRPEDAFILSKGHSASSLYATLYIKGVFSDEEIKTYYRDGTKFPAHPAALVHPSIPLAAGALGHGLPVAAGMAYARRYLKKTDSRVVCLLSDGECNEGSVWEAALFSGHHELSNLTVLIDANGLQGFGRTKDILNLEPLNKKWEAFNFRVSEIDGHDFGQLETVLTDPAIADSPHCIICRTVKGKGISFMENKMEWHYLTMNDAQYLQALKEVEDNDES